MTRFVGDAIGVRKAATGYTSKDRKRDMDAFLETGVRFGKQRHFFLNILSPLSPRRVFLYLGYFLTQILLVFSARCTLK
jgi:hypothetical protein